MVEQHVWLNNVFVFLIPGPIIEELNLELKDLDKNLELKDLSEEMEAKSDPYEEMEAKAQEEPPSHEEVPPSHEMEAKAQPKAKARRFRLKGQQAPSGWYKFSIMKT